MLRSSRDALTAILLSFMPLFIIIICDDVFLLLMTGVSKLVAVRSV